MWNSGLINMLIDGTLATLYMTLVSTFLAYVIGLPIGIILVITEEKGLNPRKIVYEVLNLLVNWTRSVPFLILLILVIPFTRLVVGKSYGSTATIIPLTLAAAPFIARLVEAALQEVDKGAIEASLSMGADTWTIVTKVLLTEARTSLIVGSTIALGTILGYSAMAGVVGGGGLGDIAIRYGYNRYEPEIMWVTVIILVMLVQILQIIGTKLSKRLDRRINN